MCLYVNTTKTRKAKLNKTGKVTLWKAVLKNSYLGRIQSAHQSTYKWYPGWNKSNCDVLALCRVYYGGDKVSKGIHVFTNRETARSHVVRWVGNYKIIRVVCYNKDLIAVGLYNDAVYTKVFVPKDEIDSALKRKGKERRR